MQYILCFLVYGPPNIFFLEMEKNKFLICYFIFLKYRRLVVNATGKKKINKQVREALSCD